MEKKLKIMVPVDFTPVSYKAIGFLSLLPEKCRAETHLVHVIQVNEADWAGTAEASDTIDRAALRLQEQQAAEQFQALKKQLEGSVTTAVLYGGLTTTLTGYASEHAIDLILMGTTGAAGWFEKLSGSDAQQVVRHTEIPVITIHQHAPVSPVRNILWVADFKTAQQPGLPTETIKTLQHLFGASIHLLQIIGTGTEPDEAEIKQHMQQFAATHQLQNYHLHLHHNYKVPEGVRNFNRESEMDLVCIGSHPGKGMGTLFFGSIAETLINRCIRPLLTYQIT